MLRTNTRLSSLWSPARILAAIALTLTASLLFYDRYEGTCMIPDYERNTFIGISALFFAGFVWLAAEIALLRMPSTLPPLVRVASAAGVGFLTYAAVGFAVWLSAPDTDDKAGASFRAYTSIAWLAGGLLKAGAFTYYSCGY